jgi:hypothetical protein
MLSLSYPMLVGRFLGISLGQQLRATLRPGAVTVLLFGLTTFWSRTLAVGSWWALAPCAALTLPIAALIAYQLGLSKTQRQQTVKRLRRALRGGSKADRLGDPEMTNSSEDELR